MVDRISEHNKVMTILDNLDSMICVCDLDYNMLYVNKSMVDAFGMDPENYTKQKCYKATRNKEEPCEFCPFGDISGQEESFPPPRNFEYIWDDKINRWVSGTNSVIRWLDGTMVLFIFMRDASHIKQQEELSMWQTKELAFQKVKLQSVFDAIPDVVFVKDLNLRFAQCNKTMRDVFNRREEDLIGKNEIDGLGYSPEAAEMVFSHERMVINEGCRVVVEETVPVLGDKRIFESVKVPLRQGDSIIGLIGIVRDITAHKRMEKKQEELAHWYKSILDATPSLISVTDADMKWTFVNKAVEDHLGTSLENMRGRPCSNWNANICNTNSCGIACAKRGENRTFFTHDGVSYQVDAEILKAMNGEVAGFIEIIQDITKIREMEEEALSASKAKSQFLANMSHEIRTPMNAIMGITEILLQDNALRPDIIEALKRIYNSGDLLLNIINEILDLSKIEAGKLELAPAKYNIASLISDTATLNMMRIGGKAIEFELSVDENTPSDLFGDELRIKQILNNLLSNAFKYTKEGLVKLSVSAEMGGPKNESEVTLVFRVSDTGQGMTEEQISRLFDEYSRFNTEANRTTEGAGLGMSITRKLIHLMNGEISVKSALDQGSEFTIYLPQGRIGSAVIGASLAENLQKFKTTGEDPVKRAQLVFEPMPYGGVLVVDDVESNLYVAKGLLSPYQLSVETVMSGYEALEKITQGKTYDVIFMDHMMPQMDGLETTQKIRAFGYSGAIVALTANALAGSDEIFRQNGFDGFISKPIDLRQLNGILHKFIRNRHPEKAKRQKPETPARTERPGITPELMRIFRRDAGKAAATLRESLAGGDIKLFTTTAHAMKSALAYIGESEASRSALALESAGHEGDTDFIAANADGFIKRLEALAESPPPAEAAEADAAEDTAFLAEQLQIVKSACEGYDDAAAYAALDRLKENAWKPKTAAALKEIRDALFLHSDFDGAAERAGAFLG
jgi:PAS domain S-box-containing protein